MIHGKNRIGFDLSQQNDRYFTAFNPAAGIELPEAFFSASMEESERAVRKAKIAYGSYKNRSGKAKATFLRAIAEEIEAGGDQIIGRAVLETGLPGTRIAGEMNRTVSQLRLFASVVEEGSWAKASIDLPQYERRPMPKPDIRKALRPIGVVAVFTASNFPLAFSTAGGDVASALAAGNPVIVKAHPYHPGVNELVANAIAEAAARTGMPDGVFSSLNAADFQIGQGLVSHPGVKAVAFTGSFSGGKALYDLAQTRGEPIPVFTEMGSVNPVLLLPEKLEREGGELAEILSASLSLGAGQFCANPGLMIGVEGSGLEYLEQALIGNIQAMKPETMLHPNISDAYYKDLKHVFSIEGVRLLCQSETEPDNGQGRPILAKTDANTFLENEELREEIFGPYSLLIVCRDAGECLTVIKSLKGQLTASAMGTEEDFSDYGELMAALQEVSGRLIFNGVPTGVEVCHSMHHGGPYPSTSDLRFTSVAVDAIKRFARPVAFQNAPDSYLPDELKDGNPLNIWRRIDGALSKDKVGVLQRH